jgi:hypothetical protein
MAAMSGSAETFMRSPVEPVELDTGVDEDITHVRNKLGHKTNQGEQVK